MIDKSLAEAFPLEDVLFSGIFRTIANVTNIQHKRGLCEHADRGYEDPAKHLFSGLLNIYLSHGFRKLLLIKKSADLLPMNNVLQIGIYFLVSRQN